MVFWTSPALATGGDAPSAWGGVGPNGSVASEPELTLAATCDAPALGASAYCLYCPICVVGVGDAWAGPPAAPLCAEVGLC